MNSLRISLVLAVLMAAGSAHAAGQCLPRAGETDAAYDARCVGDLINTIDDQDAGPSIKERTFGLCNRIEKIASRYIDTAPTIELIEKAVKCWRGQHDTSK